MSFRLILRLVGYFAAILLLLLIVVIGALGYLLHSPAGTQWLFEQIPQLTPGALRIDKVQGSLTGPLQIDGLHYRDGELSVELERLLFDWQLSELLVGRLHLLQLTLEGTRLQLPPSDTAKTEQSTPFQGISLPLAIQLDSLLVSDFQLIDPKQDTPVKIERIALQARAGQDEVVIAKLQAAAFSTQVDLTGSVRLRPDFPLQIALDWRHQLADGQELAGHGTLAGNLAELQVGQSLDPPLQGELQAKLFELASAPRWEARLQLQEALVGAFAKGFPARISGELHSSGTPQRIVADGRLNLSEPSLGEMTAELKTRYTDGTLNADRLLVTTPAGTRLEGQGQYTLNDQQGRFLADLSWQELRWPLQGEAVQFHSAQGKLHIDGSPDNYAYRLDLDVSQPDLPPAGLNASGSGNLQQLGFDELNLLLSEGRLQGSGQLTWAPEVTWQVKLQGDDLNPGLFHAEFPGKLNLALRSEGKIHQAIPLVDLHLERLEGVLRDYPISAYGELHLDDKTLQIRSLHALSGKNRIQASGSAGERLALDWSIEAPQLEALWPGLTGMLQASGKLTGSNQEPRIQANIDANRLAYQDNQVGNLRASTDIDLAGGQQLSVDLQAKNLKTAGMAWQRLQLTVGGSRERHHIELDLRGAEVPQANLVIDAGLSQQNLWQGALQQLQLDLPNLNTWKLVRPAQFTLGPQRQQVAQACLVAGAAQICGNFLGQAEQGWKTELQATRLPLELLQQWLPEATQITGQAELAAAFNADAQGQILGKADLKLPNGEFAFEVNDEPQTLDFSGAFLQSRIDPQGGHSELNLPLAGLGGIQGQVRLPGLRLPEIVFEQQALEGRVTANIADLGFISTLAPKLQNVKGRIDADFTLGGQLAAPRMMGMAALENGALDIPDAGLELRELVMRLQAPNLERLTLEGSVKSGDSKLILQGETQLQPEQGFPTELQIEGVNWLAVNIPEAVVRISPKLTIKSDRQRTDMNGEVEIPYARIRLRNLPKSAVSGSPDLVIVKEDMPEDQQLDPKVYSRLRVIFGDRVSFEGLGLRAKLTGNLLVIDEPGRPVTGSGRIGVSEGTYRAYGQDLKIERGYALFADSPVDNPGLDVRAIREVGDVTAGVRVTGTLKAPKTSVFSTPAMSETAALSYLLTGHAPGEGSGQSLGIAAAMNATGAGSLTDDISRQLGLEELRVDTGNSLQEASVVAGTYLSPRLYVQYVNDLATRETKMRLRYDLTKRLQIQTESGASQGVDLFYTIER